MTALPNKPNRRILVIDDNQSIHHDFAKVLTGRGGAKDNLQAAKAALFATAVDANTSGDFQLDFALQGQAGLELVERACSQGRPYALAFVDMRMPPGWDGIETIEHLWRIDPRLLVVICTAYSDYRWEEIAGRLGRPAEFLILKKPFDAIEVRQLATALTTKWDLQQQNAARTDEIIATRDLTVFALAELAEWRDPDTRQHLQRIREYSDLLARELQRHAPFSAQIDQNFLDDLYRASPLHDIGKVAMPDAILLKLGRLTLEEFEVMKRHTVIGAETLRRVVQRSPHANFLQMAVEVAESHHERYDGGGYPHGLRGDDIPLAARIVALADVFDTLTSPRVYKAAVEPHRARDIILREEGGHFDPAVLAAFDAVYDQFLTIHASRPGDSTNAAASLLELFGDATPLPVPTV